MQFLSNYGMFLLETLTLLVALLLAFAGIIAIASKGKGKDKGKLSITKLNEKYDEQQQEMQEIIFDKKALKALKKTEKQSAKAQEKDSKKSKKAGKKEKPRKRLFVINFEGDIRANAVHALSREITALLSVATAEDEVLVVLESGGGVVNGYGLGASQLARITQKKIPLTVAVDKVAASGGYMMACVADKIIAAPFALIGSIGVLAQIPNFNRLLKKHNIDFEQITAGEFKRTLTMFGENTDKAREKMREDIQDIHTHFKEFVAENRPVLNIEDVATGEYWLARKAFEMKLVDDLQTSDDYLLSRWPEMDLFEIKFKPKKGLADKLSHGAQSMLENFRSF